MSETKTKKTTTKKKKQTIQEELAEILPEFCTDNRTPLPVIISKKENFSPTELLLNPEEINNLPKQDSFASYKTTEQYLKLVLSLHKKPIMFPLTLGRKHFAFRSLNKSDLLDLSDVYTTFSPITSYIRIAHGKHALRACNIIMNPKDLKKIKKRLLKNNLKYSPEYDAKRKITQVYIWTFFDKVTAPLQYAIFKRNAILQFERNFERLYPRLSNSVPRGQIMFSPQSNKEDYFGHYDSFDEATEDYILIAPSKSKIEQGGLISLEALQELKDQLSYFMYLGEREDN